MNGSYFCDIHDMLNVRAIRDENKEMVGKEENAVIGQSFVGYVRISSKKTATSLNNTAIVAYTMLAVLMNFRSLFLS